MHKIQLKVPPPVYLALTAGLMWWLNTLYPQTHFMGSFYSLLAITVIGLGLALDLTALWQFLATKTTPSPFSPHKANALVTSGWYRFSRNPMYLGMTCLLIGWALYLGNAYVLLFTPFFVLILTVMQIKPEEAALRKLFGEEFEQYCKRVRRWI